MFAYLFCFKVRNKREKDVSIPRKRKEADASKEKTGLSSSLKKPHRRRRREISFAREEVNARVHIKKNARIPQTPHPERCKIALIHPFLSSHRALAAAQKNDFFFPRVKREREKERNLPPPTKTPTKLPRSRSKRRANTTRIRRHPFSFAQNYGAFTRERAQKDAVEATLKNTQQNRAYLFLPGQKNL